MDNPDGDQWADLDAEMNAIGESPPDVEMPLPAAVPAPAPVAIPQPLSLFNYGAAPTGPAVLLESKNGNIVATPKTDKVNCRIDAIEFSAYAMDFERHGSTAGLKYVWESSSAM